MKLMKKNRFVITLTLILILLCISGCGRKVKDEQEILTDVQNYESEINFADFSETVKIEKRQTNMDDKEDTVYVTIRGENEYAIQSYYCILYYNFYDQGGWILDDMEVIDFYVKDLSTRDNEEVLATFNNDPDAYVTGTFDTINFTNVEDVNFDAETFYSYKRIFFETRCDKTLKYTTKNTYELNELYNPQTGKWENEYSYTRIAAQSLDNMDNIIWLGTPNENGVYSYMQMRPVPEGI